MREGLVGGWQPGARGGTMLRHRPGVPEGLERGHTAGERPILGTFLGKDDSELFRF